jgi:hypothetical protein
VAGADARHARVRDDPGMLAVVNATVAGVIAAMAASVVGTGPGIAAAAGVLAAAWLHGREGSNPPMATVRRHA